jgi:hypothetical protein
MVGLRKVVASLAAFLAGCAIVAGLGDDYPGSAATDAGPPKEAAPPEDAAPPVMPSCRDLYAAAPATRGKSGFYTIAPDSGPLDAYCEMSIDDGGWTLVARSAPNGTGKFGWNVTTGSVRDLIRPYALNALEAGVSFTEVMIADHASGGFGVATHAYKFELRDFDLPQHPNDSISTIMVASVFGDCSDGGLDEAQMLRYAGYTTLEDDFFMRDIQGNDQHRGLHADKIDLTYPDCRSGLLDGQQGLLFVR